jgi:hypothetical protein
LPSTPVDAVIAQSKSYAMRALKLRVPSSLLALADEVIE